jgi:signal transduction histidine kinase
LLYPDYNALLKRKWFILLAVLMVVWGVFIWQYETYRQNRMNQLTKQYAIFLQPYLWNFDKKNLRDTLKFITQSQRFRSARVLQEDGNTFAQAKQTEHRGLIDDLLRQTGLIRSVQFIHPLNHNGQRIGSLHIHWLNRSVYMHAYAGLMLFLIGALIYFYLANRSRKRELRRLRLEQERRAREEAEAAAQAKSDFLAKMSHELRTPLTAIIGYSEMLNEQYENFDDEQVRSDLEKIENAGNHLHDLINNILDLSKIEADKVELSLSEFDLRDVCHDVRGTLQPLAEQNNNDFSLDLPGEPITLRADRTKVRQCLFNLVSNACKYTEDGSIELELEEESRSGTEGVRLSVSDDGRGIEQDRLDKIFEAFEQDEAADNYPDGTGLGLTITQKFCEIMGGNLTAESEPGVGSTFTIWLPKNVERTGVS